MARRTYQSAVELFAMLCKEYGLNPLANGVIISHKEGHKRGIASNHGDPEHLWKGLGLSYTMDGFRKDVKAEMEKETLADGMVSIMDTAVATAEQMKVYLKGVNPAVPQSVLDMIPLYLSEGMAEGVRGDVAFAQSCLETGSFGFSKSAVTLDQNNFAGMGVTKNGMRGSAPYEQWLGIQENPQKLGWVAGAGYGEKILTILSKILGTSASEENTFKPYMVRVSISNLNIRKGPGTDYAKTGRHTGKRSFTIVEEKVVKVPFVDGADSKAEQGGSLGIM